MTSVEEFAFISTQLAWLEEHLRGRAPGAQNPRMDGALDALACARTVIVELAQIGADVDRPRAAPVP
ncbi:MAG: hypothetical protein V4569_08165 [Pseudomonadota bacterium]